MNYEEAVEYVYSLPNCSFKRYGLSGILELLKYLKDPQNSQKYIHVTGTNGKGSVCTFCASCLKAAGYKTGLYISPYVVNFRERIQINGRYIEKGEFSDIVFELKGIVEKLNKDGVFLTSFDFLTAVAIHYFYVKNCDISVLEVGMGGRLDSTNVILKPEVSILTHIDYDHVEELGGKEKSLFNIAKEKLGILKKGTVCVFENNQHKEVLDLIKYECVEKNIKFFPSCNITNICCNKNHTKFEAFGDIFETNLLGPHQAKNGAVALTALLKVLNLNIKYIKKGLKEAFIPARLEIIKNKPLVVLDGAHNENGVESLKKSIEQIFSDGPKIGVLSIINTKDYKAMLKKLVGVFDYIIITKMDYEKGISGVILKKAADSVGLNSILEEDFKNAVSLAKKLAGNEGTIIFFGSLYFAGQVRKFLC